MWNASDQLVENEWQWRKKQTGTHATKSFVITNDISSIKRVIRKFVKNQVVVLKNNNEMEWQKNVIHVHCYCFAN